MSSTRQLILCLVVMVACLMTSCSNNRALKYHNFPDAVTSLDQVDPAYRKYFAGQQGRNYSVDDQRKALAAAIRTSRTPVPAYVPRSAMASSRKTYSSKRYVASRKRSTYRRSKAVSRKRAVAKRKTVTRKRSVAKRKTSTRRRRG